MNVHNIIEKYTISTGQPIVADLKESKGSWLVDKITKKKYLDCASQYASQALGWNHPALLECDFGHTIYTKLANPDLYSEELAHFIETFHTLIPDFSKSFYIDGGALAVENAIKAAMDWKAKMRGWDDAQANNVDIVHFKQAFHGRSGYTLSLTNTTPDKTDLFPKFPWTRVVNPKEGLEEQSLNEIKIALERNNVAAVVIEPIQGEGGDNHFKPEFFQALRKLVDQYETMLVFDEVQTGVGMTGKMWCYEHFGMVPDLMAFGKKTQVCGFCSTDKINSVPNVLNTPYRICSTWGGNIVDMVRFTTIAKTILVDKLIENAAEIGTYLLSKLKEIPNITNVRGRGLILAFDLENTTRRNEVLKKLRENMLILQCGEKSIRLRPHLTFSKVDAMQALEYISQGTK